MSNKLKKSHPSGMTLVEILFAFAIIGSIITISYSSALRGWRSAQVANQRTQAQIVAQNAIEKVKAYRDLNIPASAVPPNQQHMRWAVYNMGSPNGSLGFLYSIGMDTPSPPAYPSTDTFAVEECTGLAGSPSEDCFWKVTGGRTGTPRRPETAISDSTTYDVGISVIGVTCTGQSLPGVNPPCLTNTLDDVAVIEIVAKVTYIDAFGIASNAEANTILTKSEY